jgi:SAM pointed domain-containing ETS transcription factor
MNQDETDVMSPVTAPAAAPEPIQQTRPAQVAPIRTSSNIHLWQFVKELLNQPQNHSGCIHWIDREQGIFKIVDSVRVAELWGRRKNRPAMNFDKLSRSLRQYYKKGIMKKTSRPQRLVYQFCTPYHL